MNMVKYINEQFFRPSAAQPKAGLMLLKAA
jgi:hypothetical protein